MQAAWDTVGKPRSIYAAGEVETAGWTLGRVYALSALCRPVLSPKCTLPHWQRERPVVTAQNHGKPQCEKAH